ncbi:MAG: hypothetical protein AAFQ90_02860 [Pseudomonadota bacterium]
MTPPLPAPAAAPTASPTAAPPSPTSSAKPPTARKIEVRIGAIEVTVPPPPAPQIVQAPLATSEPPAIGLSLDAFIAESSA